jgi:hypothetical protein
LAASFTLPVLVFDFPQNLYTIHAVEGVRLFCTFSLLPIAILGLGPRIVIDLFECDFCVLEAPVAGAGGQAGDVSLSLSHDSGAHGSSGA